jgi:chromosome segregation ATPase
MSKELKPIDFSEYSSDSDDSVIDVYENPYVLHSREIKNLENELELWKSRAKYYKNKWNYTNDKFKRTKKLYKKLEEENNKLNKDWAKKRDEWNEEYRTMNQEINTLKEGTGIDQLGCKASDLNLEMCKIYVIEDKDGKKYVGQTTQPIICRYIQHLKTNDCNSRLLDLENSIIKCIDVCDPKDKYKVEKQWIEKIDSVNKNGNKINKEIMELNDTGDDEIHGF